MYLVRSSLSFLDLFTCVYCYCSCCVFRFSWNLQLEILVRVIVVKLWERVYKSTGQRNSLSER